MRLGVQSGLLRLYPLDLALEKIREAGYDGVELWGGRLHGYILDLVRTLDGDFELNEELVTRVKSLCDRNGLEIVCYTPEQVLYPLNVLIDAAAPLDGTRMRRNSRRLLELSVDVAETLGCGRVVIASPMWQWRRTDRGYARATRDQVIEAVIDEVAGLVSYAAARGGTILFEAQVEDFTNAIITLEDTALLLDRIPSPHLQVLLDTGHVQVTASRLGRDGVAYFREHVAAFKGRLGHVHIDDNAGDTDTHLAPGAGTIDIAGMVAALVEAGYQGWLAPELNILGAYVIPETAERLLRESREYLERILSSPTDGWHR